MFHFQKALPIPLLDQVAQSDVWLGERVFNAHERYFITAPSGKGKTTFQHILYGLRQDYTGEVLVDWKENKGVRLRDLTLDQWAELRQRHISVIFQDLRLFLPLTAWENLLLKNDLTQHKTEDQIREMAAYLDVDSLLQKRCDQLSYGQRQRFAIIRALCQPFQTLLMDEPFSHLDTDNIKKCCSLIQRETQTQKAGFMLASLGEKYFFEYNQELTL